MRVLAGVAPLAGSHCVEVLARELLRVMGERTLLSLPTPRRHKVLTEALPWELGQTSGRHILQTMREATPFPTHALALEVMGTWGFLSLGELLLDALRFGVFARTFLIGLVVAEEGLFSGLLVCLASSLGGGGLLGLEEMAFFLAANERT